jgi:uncharacterized membrane protein
VSIKSPPQVTSNSDNRPLLIGASCVALAALVPVALYQLSLIPELPDPPSGIFASESITMSKTAHPLGVPDALLGLASFGVTLGLALLARQGSRAKKLLGAKLTLDATMAAFNGGRQVIEFGKLCSWCTVTALSAGVMAYAGRSSISDAMQEAAGFLQPSFFARRTSCRVSEVR